MIRSQFRNINMLTPRKLSNSKSIFYRGISLRQYIKKSAETCPDLNYKDDQTILVDENNSPIVIDNSFIITDRSQPSLPISIEDFDNIFIDETASKKDRYVLPTLNMGKRYKQLQSKFHSQRNSTDTSQTKEYQYNRQFLPTLKKVVERQRNVTQASRSSSRSISCRKKVASILENPEGRCSLQKMNNGKISSTKAYLDFLKRQKLGKQHTVSSVFPQPANVKRRYEDVEIRQRQ